MGLYKNIIQLGALLFKFTHFIHSNSTPFSFKNSLFPSVSSVSLSASHIPVSRAPSFPLNFYTFTYSFSIAFFTLIPFLLALPVKYPCKLLQMISVHPLLYRDSLFSLLTVQLLLSFFPLFHIFFYKLL
jgi:hypothetical protein